MRDDIPTIHPQLTRDSLKPRDRLAHFFGSHIFHPFDDTKPQRIQIIKRIIRKLDLSNAHSREFLL